MSCFSWLSCSGDNILSRRFGVSVMKKVSPPTDYCPPAWVGTLLLIGDKEAEHNFILLAINENNLKNLRTGTFLSLPHSHIRVHLRLAKCCTFFFFCGIILKWHITLRSGSFPKSFFEEMRGKWKLKIIVCFDANWLCLNVLLKNDSS